MPKSGIRRWLKTKRFGNCDVDTESFSFLPQTRWPAHHGWPELVDFVQHPGCKCTPVCTENLIRIDFGGNHLTSVHNDRAAMFCLYRLGLAIQVEEPT